MNFFGAFRAVLSLAREVRRCAVALERIALSLELQRKGKAAGFVSYTTDPGEGAVMLQTDEDFSTLFELEERMRRSRGDVKLDDPLE